MGIDTQELLRTYEQLPERQRMAVSDFARFLLAQEADERWERILADAKPRPKLDAFLQKSKAEGAAPMDLERL